MFTGLVQCLGRVSQIDARDDGSRLTIETPDLRPQLMMGASVAIDGCCTTVVELTETGFAVDASLETLDKTIMRDYEVGTPVNLELPLTLSTPLGGHFVTGHVDGQITLVDKKELGNCWEMKFRVENVRLLPYFIDKGSVAVSGISLTVNTIEQDCFTVAIIPHTMDMTTLGTAKVGQRFNVETDMLGKYVQRFLDCRQYQQERQPALTGPQIYAGNWFIHDNHE